MSTERATIPSELIELLIRKREYISAINMMIYVSKRKKVTLIRKILRSLLNPEDIYIDEARKIIKLISDSREQDKWICKISIIQRRYGLLDDARYTATSIKDSSMKGEYICGLLALDNKREDADPVKKVEKYISLGMFKRARKVADNLREYQRTAYLNLLPSDGIVNNATLKLKLKPETVSD